MRIILVVLFIVAAGGVASAQYGNFQKFPVHYQVQDATDQVPGGRLQYGTPVEYDPGMAARLQPAYQNKGE